MDSAFKDMVNRDLRNVFHNLDEFAEMESFRYDGNLYNLPIIVDDDTSSDRKILADDNGLGVFMADLLLFINQDDLGFAPKKDREVEFRGNTYNILKVGEESGEIILYLKTYDE
ncbi:MAG: hypothetical protein ACK5LX_10265 [Oscillospiraceae bacterium]